MLHQAPHLGPAVAVLLGLMLGAPAVAQDPPAVSPEAVLERLEAALGAATAAPEPLPEGVRFLVRFADDVGGLAVGSPVTVKGRRVGTVREVAVVIDSTQAVIDVPVVIDVVPEQISIDGGAPADEAAFYALAERLVANGLRAALESVSPLGGAQRVALAFAPEADPAVLGRDGRYPEIPTAPSLTQQLRSTVEALLARVADLPLEQVVSEATATLVELRALVTAPEVREMLTNLVEAGRELRTIVAGLDARLDPSIGAVQRAAGSVETAARETAVAVTGLQNTVGPRSPLWDELLQTSRELAGTTRALRLLVEYLERHPDALLRGRREIEP